MERILPDGTEEWGDGEEKICPIYGKEYESRRMKKVLTKAAWLRYIDSWEDYYEFPSLGTQYKLVNPRHSPGQSVDVEVKANVAPNVDESRVKAVPDHDDDWDFEAAVGLNEVERVGV